MENYEINEETLAIVPINKKMSRVYELNDDFIVNKTPYQIMDDSCSYFGSSLTGRQLGSKNILGTGYKVPIVVEEIKDIVFFPASSPLIEDKCEWIALNCIKEYTKKEKKTIIKFENNKEIIVNAPYLSIQNQVFRATRLSSILKKRKNI